MINDNEDDDDDDDDDDDGHSIWGYQALRLKTISDTSTELTNDISLWHLVFSCFYRIRWTDSYMEHGHGGTSNAPGCEIWQETYQFHHFFQFQNSLNINIWSSCFFERYFRRTVNVWTVWTCHVQSKMDPESMGSRKFSATCYVSAKKSNVIWTLIISCSLTAWYPLQIMFKWFKCLYSIYIYSIYIYTVYIYIPPLIPTQGVQTAEVQTLPFLRPLGTKQNFASP